MYSRAKVRPSLRPLVRCRGGCVWLHPVSLVLSREAYCALSLTTIIRLSNTAYTPPPLLVLQAMADSALSRMDGLPVSIASLGLLYCKVPAASPPLWSHTMPRARAVSWYIPSHPRPHASHRTTAVTIPGQNDGVVGQDGQGLNLIDIAMLPLTPIVGNGTAPLQVRPSLRPFFPPTTQPPSIPAACYNHPPHPYRWPNCPRTPHFYPRSCQPQEVTDAAERLAFLAFCDPATRPMDGFATAHRCPFYPIPSHYSPAPPPHLSTTTYTPRVPPRTTQYRENQGVRAVETPHLHAPPLRRRRARDVEHPRAAGTLRLVPTERHGVQACLRRLPQLRTGASFLRPYANPTKSPLVSPLVSTLLPALHFVRVRRRCSTTRRWAT